MEYNHITEESKGEKSLQLTVTNLEEAHVTLCKIKTSKFLEELTLVSPLPDIELVQLCQDGLQGNKSIKSLTLELTECSDEGIGNVLNILNQNHTLQSLTLKLNNVSSLGATKIAHLLPLSCLTSFAIYGTQLDLHDLCIQDNGAFQVAMATRNCTTLSELTISQSGITGVGVAKIMTSLQTHPSLITLNLSSNDIDITGVKAIATSLPNMVTLKQLVLDNNRNIGDEGIKVLSYSLNHTLHLKILSLKSCNITKVGVAILAKYLENLTEIILSGNVAIGNEGVELISKALEKTSTLQKLDLSRCGISDEGCYPLAQAMLGNTSLSFLCLHGNTICDSGILTLCDTLEFNQTLQCLDLSENRFGEQGTTGLLHCLRVNNTLTSLTILTPSSHHHLLSTFDIILSKNKELKRYETQIKQLQTENATLKKEKDWLSWELGNRL